MNVVRDLQVQVRFEDGSLWATVDEYPGVFATGDNFEELSESLAEGIAMMIALPGEEPPQVVVRAPERQESEPISTTATLVCARA